eukprot:s196_g32.t1
MYASKSQQGLKVFFSSDKVLVMELAERPLQPGDEVGAEMKSALEKLHGLGYVHLDVKPANFLMKRKGRATHVCLADFGTVLATQTKVPQFVGTAMFAAPGLHGPYPVAVLDDVPDRFQITGVIGKGAFGTVYTAFDRTMKIKAWHLVTWSFVFCGRRGVWRGTCGTQLALVTRLVPGGRRLILRGRRGTWRHRPSLCVAGVALGDMDFHFVWQAWHLASWTFVWQAWHLWHSAGSCDALVPAGIARMQYDIEKTLRTRTPEEWKKGAGPKEKARTDKQAKSAAKAKARLAAKKAAEEEKKKKAAEEAAAHAAYKKLLKEQRQCRTEESKKNKKKLARAKAKATKKREKRKDAREQPEEPAAKRAYNQDLAENNLVSAGIVYQIQSGRTSRAVFGLSCCLWRREKWRPTKIRRRMKLSRATKALPQSHGASLRMGRRKEEPMSDISGAQHRKNAMREDTEGRCFVDHW